MSTNLTIEPRSRDSGLFFVPGAPGIKREERRRRRRLLAWSMLAVVPLGLFSIGVGANVAIAWAATNSYAQGDYLGSAGWSRANVSLNPIDLYLPHYNLGTAYAAAELLDEAESELLTSLDHAPSKEATCDPRANLALVYEDMGDREQAVDKFQDAADRYAQSASVWQTVVDDKCYTGDSEDNAESNQDRSEQKQQDAQAQQDEQDQQDQQQGGGTGTGGTGSGDPSTDPADPSTDPADPGTDPTDPADPSDPGTDPADPGTDPTDPADPSTDPGTDQGGSGGDEADEPTTLGDKLGELRNRNGQADRARGQGDPSSSGGGDYASKPW